MNTGKCDKNAVEKLITIFDFDKMAVFFRRQMTEIVRLLMRDV